MIGVDANTVTLEVKRILTKFGMTQLIFVKVGPTPYSSIDHMGEAFTSSNLGRVGRGERGGERGGGQRREGRGDRGGR